MSEKHVSYRALSGRELEQRDRKASRRKAARNSARTGVRIAEFVFNLGVLVFAGLTLAAIIYGFMSSDELAARQFLLGLFH